MKHFAKFSSKDFELHDTYIKNIQRPLIGDLIKTQDSLFIIVGLKDWTPVNRIVERIKCPLYENDIVIHQGLVYKFTCKGTGSHFNLINQNTIKDEIACLSRDIQRVF